MVRHSKGTDTIYSCRYRIAAGNPQFLGSLFHSTQHTRPFVDEEESKTGSYNNIALLPARKRRRLRQQSKSEKDVELVLHFDSNQYHSAQHRTIHCITQLMQLSPPCVPLGFDLQVCNSAGQLGLVCCIAFLSGSTGVYP